MEKHVSNASEVSKQMEEHDLSKMQGKAEGRYSDFNKMESDFLEGHCCYECYIAALKERIAWLIIENNRLREGKL